MLVFYNLYITIRKKGRHGQMLRSGEYLHKKAPFRNILKGAFYNFSHLNP